jgi:outer membrane receptor protein involved in Fe transport
MALSKMCCFVLFLYVLVDFPSIYSQEKEAEPVKKEEEKAKASQAPVKKAEAPPGPPWWTMSAMVNQDKKWKFHIETESKFTYQTGTLDSHLIEISGLLGVRKDRFTNFTFADMGFMSAKQHFAIYTPDENGVLVKQELSQKILMRKYQFVDVFRTDFTKNFFMDFGWEWVRDDMSFIQERNTYFGGLGYQFDVNKKHNFSFIGGVGYEETKYTPRDELELRGIPATIVIEETPDSAAAFFQYKGSQKISDSISFHQSLFYVHYLDDERVNRWECKLRIMYRLRQSLSFFTAYEATFEDNKTSDAAGGEKLNTKIVTGIRFSF